MIEIPSGRGWRGIWGSGILQLAHLTNCWAWGQVLPLPPKQCYLPCLLSNLFSVCLMTAVFMALCALRKKLAVLWAWGLSPLGAQPTCEQGDICLTDIRSQWQGSVMFLPVAAENDRQKRTMKDRMKMNVHLDFRTGYCRKTLRTD